MKIAEAREKVKDLIWNQANVYGDQIMSRDTLDAIRAVLKDSQRNAKKTPKIVKTPNFMVGLPKFEGKIGEEIPVKFGNKVYKTRIDHMGTQRFLPIPGYEKYAEDFMIDGGPNEWIARMYKGELTSQEVFNRRIGGYSISGFCDCYPSYQCINPLWET